MEFDPAQFADRLVSGMSDAIIYADAEGMIGRWNRGATRIFGFAEEEALGRSLDIIIPESLRERHWQGFRATMRTGESRYGDGQVLSVPAVRKDGARISVEFTIVPFTSDSGQMIGIAAIMRDTTTRFEELRALRRQLAAHPAATGAKAKIPNHDGTRFRFARDSPLEEAGFEPSVPRKTPGIIMVSVLVRAASSVGRESSTGDLSPSRSLGRVTRY
jgi:PAS domain S-box-containing protein